MGKVHYSLHKVMLGSAEGVVPGMGEYVASGSLTTTSTGVSGAAVVPDGAYYMKVLPAGTANGVVRLRAGATPTAGADSGEPFAEGIPAVMLVNPGDKIAWHEE